MLYSDELCGGAMSPNDSACGNVGVALAVPRLDIFGEFVPSGDAPRRVVVLHPVHVCRWRSFAFVLHTLRTWLRLHQQKERTRALQACQEASMKRKDRREH